MTESIRFGDLRRQIASMRPEIDAALARVLDRGWFILGEEGEAFEREFAAHTGVAQAVGVASGTEAIALALAALGVGPGDEVITVSATAIPTAAAIRQAGATPVFVDVDGSHTLDPEHLAAAATPRTRAIVPVHLYGQPADMAAILDFAARRGLLIVEDASQAHDATIEGRKVGTLADVGCFSFYPSKNLGAFGDAGAVVTNDDGIAARLRSLRNYGQSRRDHADLPGINSRLDEMQAAILRAKLRHLDAWTERRIEVAAIYNEALRDLETMGFLTLPRPRERARHVYHLYAIMADRREMLRAHLASKGIETLIHYPLPVHRQPIYSKCAAFPPEMDRTEAWSARTLSLPMYPELRDDEALRVAEAVRAFYQG